MEHKQNLKISYKFSSFNLFVEPLLLVGFFFGIFVVLMVLSRLSLKIYTKPLLPQSVASTLEEIFNSRESLHRTLDSTLHQYPLSEPHHWESARKLAVSTFPKKAAQVNELISRIPLHLQDLVLEIEDKQKSKVEAQLEYGDLLVKCKGKPDQDTPEGRRLVQLEENYRDSEVSLEDLIEDLQNPQ
eukprot:TRINITY_DN14604_c0_g1_i4.p1 TRINITY_DN14604_c0_g1~~TRINITY_DN14604_c0_g1_i4.p1  ORF type:complete len:186 (+),score=48.22 TRINITY_DN14604_c0_g1_i4:322-879(+)